LVLLGIKRKKDLEVEVLLGTLSSIKVTLNLKRHFKEPLDKESAVKSAWNVAEIL
jgi:hypothetical protein